MTTGGISNLHPELRRAENFQLRSITETFPIDTLHLIDIEKEATGRVLDKSVRKDEVKLDRLRRFGVIPEAIQIGGHCIVDTKRGDRFTELVDEAGEGFFVKLRNAEVVKEKPESISVVSGPCLFDVASATARISYNGRTVSLMAPEQSSSGYFEQLSIGDEITLYEAESIERLSRCIGLLSRGNPRLRTVEINLPRIEYYLNASEAFRIGSLINRDEALRFFDTVDARARRISSLFARRIMRYCDVGVEVRSSEPLVALEPHIRSMVSNGLIPNLDEMIGILKSTGLLSHILLNEQPPQNFNQLGYTGYMLAELRPTMEPGALVLAVENHPEERILEGILKKGQEHKSSRSQGPNVMGIYPFPMVIPHETKRNSLYWLEAPATLGNIKQVLAPYRKRK